LGLPGNRIHWSKLGAVIAAMGALHYQAHVHMAALCIWWHCRPMKYGHVFSQKVEMIWFHRYCN
jgi:hypothetical protein